MRCICEQKILKNVSHSNITDNRDLLGSLLWGDGRHLAFVHTTERSKFNCSCAVPRSVRGCWIVTTWETQKEQLWSVALAPYFSIGIPHQGTVAESTIWNSALTPKLCSNSAAQNIHTEQSQLHKTGVLSSPTFFHRNRREKRKAPPLHHFFSPYQELPALQSLTIHEAIALWWCKIWSLTPLWLL